MQVPCWHSARPYSEPTAFSKILIEVTAIQRFFIATVLMYKTYHAHTRVRGPLLTISQRQGRAQNGNWRTRRGVAYFTAVVMPSMAVPL